MKRNSVSMDVNAPLKAVEDILKDPGQFITNWPYVVRVRRSDGIIAEIEFPFFVFRFHDEYTFTFHEDYNSFIYEGNGRNGTLVVTVTLREWQKKTSVRVDLSYSGRREFFIRKPLEFLTRGIAESLRDLAESSKVELSAKTEEAIGDVDFSDPVSVANFLAKAKMVHNGLHLIQEGKFFDVLHEIMEKAGSDVIYVSGITSDGTKGFKVLLRGTQVLAVEIRSGTSVETVKVTDEMTAQRALHLLSNVSGAYMLNAWVPAGGV
ncbi:hypothetical protein [Thermococcus sp.]